MLVIKHCWTFLLGHCCSLQGKISVASDVLQGIPSGSGVGLLQILVRNCVPPLQVTEHSEKWPHKLQPPFTNEQINICLCYLLF